jgi:hypothetical protein
MRVPRPPFDLVRARRVLDSVTRGIGYELAQVEDDPSALAGLAVDALARAALLTALEPDSPEILRALRTCARAAAAAFALGRAGRALELPLAGDQPVRLEGAIDASLLNASLWDRGAWAALCCDDVRSFAVLAAVHVADLEASPAHGPPSAYATTAALRFVGAPAPLLAERLVQALERLDPGGLSPEEADVATRLEAPPLDLMFSALQGDAARVDSDLARALQLFEGYWAREEWSPAALFPHAVAGAARFAVLRGVPLTLTSEYLPRVILAAPPSGDTVVCCPYCRTPVAEGAAVCPGCLEDPRHDALVELSAAEYRDAPRGPCPLCGAPKLTRAIRCPSCRRRVPR